MIGVFITARLGSTRLSEKHLIKVNEKPIIWYLIERFLIGFKEEIEKKELKLFITTSVSHENKKFESVFDKNEVEVFYGSDENIPFRHLECAIEHNIDNIVSSYGAYAGLKPDGSVICWGHYEHGGDINRLFKSSSSLISSNDINNIIETNINKTNDKIYKIYIERCEHYIDFPPENFNGVFLHTTKG